MGERGQADVSRYGRGGCRSMKEFSKELIRGESCLMQGLDGGIVRVVDSVLLKLVNPQASEMLVQTEQACVDGSRTPTEVLPSAIRRPDENQFITAKRILRRHLKIDENRVKINAKSVRYFQQDKALPEYPGITTVYRM